MRSRLFLKLFGAFLIIGLGATLGLDLAARTIWRDSLARETQDSLLHRAQLVGELAQHSPGIDLQTFVHEQAPRAGARITIIQANGVVLADSESNPQHMENHATRPEVAAVLHGSASASSSRRSATVGVEYLYLAVPFRGGVLRLAYPLSALQSALALALRSVAAVSLVVLLVAAVLAGLYTRSVAARLRTVTRFAESIASGDFSARVDDRSGDELAAMARALDKTADKIEESFHDLQTSRNQLSAVLNSMQEAVLAIADDRRISWANGRMRLLLGEGLQVGAAFIEAVRDPEVVTAIQQTLETQETVVTRSQLLLQGRTFQVAVAPMPSGGAVAVWQEITAIEQVEKTRRDFIANVSHELRTPLTSVQGYVETLAEMVSEGEPRELLEVVRKNAARMSRLTEDLLALARVESGEDKLELRTYSPSELLEEALEAANALKLGMPVQVENAANARVRADAEKVHQVFLNLIENVGRYGRSPRGAVVGARDSGDRVEFFVRDYGPGIPSEHLPRVFERFYRVDKARSAGTASTGLGLAIVKHIVLKHGGRIWAESELNAGATFYFSLPRAEG